MSSSVSGGGGVAAAAGSAAAEDTSECGSGTDLPKPTTTPKIIHRGDTIIKSFIDEATGKISAYEVGLKLEVSDFSGKWFPAKVVEVDTRENEILVHFENWSSRFDEWIKMDSNRLRASCNTNVVKLQFKEGEKVDAIWSSDGKRYPGVILSVLPNDYYQVLFDDGIKLKKKHNQIFKVKPGEPESMSKGPTATAPVQSPTARGTTTTKTLRSLPELTPISQLQRAPSRFPSIFPITSASKPPTLSPLIPAGDNAALRNRKPTLAPAPPTPPATLTEPELGKRRRTIQDYSALLRQSTSRSGSIDSNASPKSPQSSDPAASTLLPVRRKPGPKPGSKRKIPQNSSDLVEVLVAKAPEYDISYSNSTLEFSVPPKLEQQKIITPEMSPVKKRGRGRPHSVRTTTSDETGPPEDDDDKPPTIDIILPAPEEESTPPTLTKRPRKATEKALALLAAEAEEQASRRRSFSRRKSAVSSGASSTITPTTQNRKRHATPTSPKPLSPVPTPISPHQIEQTGTPVVEISSPQTPDKPIPETQAPCSAPPLLTTQTAKTSQIKRRKTFDTGLIQTANAVASSSKVEEPSPGTSASADAPSSTVPSKRKRTVHDYSMLLKTRPKFFFDIEEEEQRPNRLSRPKKNRLQSQQTQNEAKTPALEVSATLPTTSTIEIVPIISTSIASDPPVPEQAAGKSQADSSKEEIDKVLPAKRSLRRGSSTLGRGNSAAETELEPKILPQNLHSSSTSTPIIHSTRRKSTGRLSVSFSEEISISKDPVTEISHGKENITAKKSHADKKEEIYKNEPISTPQESKPKPSVKNQKPLPGLLPLRLPPLKKKPRPTSNKWWKKKSSANRVRNRNANSAAYVNNSTMTFRKQTPTTSSSSKIIKKYNLKQGDILSGISSGRIKSIRDELYQDGFRKFVIGKPAFKEVAVDIINCYCGLTEEHGLMIQCELCQCWQHGHCYDIETVKDMPVNYVCESCTGPDELRPSMEMDWNYDFHKTGKVPKLSGSRHMEPTKTKAIQESNELMERLYQVQEIVRSTRVNLNILNSKPDHPKLYQWDKPHVTIKEENHQKEFNKLYKPVLRRLIYHHKDDPTYIEKLRKKVEAAVNQRNTEFNTKIQKQFYESSAFLNQKRKLSENSSQHQQPLPILSPLLDLPGTSRALVRDENAKKIKQQNLMEKVLIHDPIQAKLPSVVIKPENPANEISILLQDMLSKIEIETQMQNSKDFGLEKVKENVFILPKIDKTDTKTRSLANEVKNSQVDSENKKLEDVSAAEVGNILLGLQRQCQPIHLEKSKELKGSESNPTQEIPNDVSSQKLKPEVTATETSKPIELTQTLTTMLDPSTIQIVLESVPEVQKLKSATTTGSDQQPVLVPLMSTETGSLLDSSSIFPLISDVAGATSITIPDVDLNTNPELLMEMDPSDPKFSSIAADLVKSCCEEPEGLIKTLEDLAQTTGETESSGTGLETDLVEIEEATDSDLLTFLDEVFVGNLDNGFIPTTSSSTSSANMTRPIPAPTAATRSNISTPSPITLTRITPELCRENLTLTIRDQQKMIDEYLDEIEVKVTELERQRYGNPYAYQQPRHIDRLHRKIRSMLKNLNLLKKLEIKADTQLREDKRYEPLTTDESDAEDVEED